MQNLTITQYLYILAFFLCCSHTFADVYQWTDKDGRTHFGDRPPETVDSKDISEKLDRINITSDYSSPDIMLRHEQSKDAERQKRINEWKESQKNRPTLADRCETARRQLKVIRGRVVFVDDNGKDLNISEETRKQRVQTLETLIRKHCQ